MKFRYLRYYHSQKYVKKPHHKKKNLTPDPWRAERRLDRRRGKWSNGSWCRPGTLKPYKKVSNRKHRRMSARKLKKGLYEDIPQHSKAKNQLRDHWMWC